MRPKLSKWGIMLVGRCENGGHYQHWFWHRRAPIKSLLNIPAAIRQCRALEDRNEMI